MNRKLLAVTMLALCIGMTVRIAPDIAAMPPELKTHSDAVPTPQAPSAPAPVPSSDSFESQVEQWIRTLSAQEQFESWQGARWTRYPLGAGMHGWLVLLNKGGKEIGYLVVGATEDGQLKLVEYGLGDKPLFSMETLYQSMIQLDLIRTSDDWIAALQSPVPPERLYFSPLHAVWRIAAGNEWIYIDAKTGEQLPLISQSFEGLDASTAALPQAGIIPGLMNRALRLLTFDPFEKTNWITDSPLPVETSGELVAVLGPRSQPVTFTANLYGKTVLVPFAVTGFHEWSQSSPFVLLEQDGARYVPFDVLKKHGAFFQERSG